MMKCPYCVEEINDSAIVCRYCHRDLHLVSPLTQKVAALEKEISELNRVVDTFTPSSATTPSSPSADAPKRRIVTISAIAVVVGAAGSSICYWLGTILNSNVFIPLSIGFPALSGLGTGLFIRGRHIKLYALLGLLIGFIDFLCTLFIYRGGQLWPLPRDWIEGFLVYLLGQSVLFVLSGITADWFESRFFHDPRSSKLSTRVAIGLAGIRAGNSKDKMKDVEFWKSVLSALTPILALIGSIITGYLSYLAALAKN